MENDCCAQKIDYVPFDHATLIENPTLLKNLARFYCSIWMDDPAFGEYRKCPVCEKFYNKNEVETDGITACSGVKSPHPTTTLVLGWEPDIVADEELLGNSQKYGDNFYGIYAVDTSTNKIVGFTWGWLETIDVIEEKWGAKIAEMLGNTNSTYYSEIAVDPSNTYRSKRIGKTLCSLLTMWMSTAHPSIPSFLRTHSSSKAKKMFEKAGYRYFADDPQHGDGRIMMMIAQGKDLIA